MKKQIGLSLLCSGIGFVLLTHFAFASSTGILYPTSDGNYKQFLLSTGSTHYTLVDETSCNGNTDYVYTTTTTKRDSYGVNISSIGNGGIVSQVDIVPCASRQTTGTGSATSNVFYRYNGIDSSDLGNYGLASSTTPVQLATTTFPTLNLFKTSTSTFEIGAVYATGTKGFRLSRLATVLTYSLNTATAPTNLVATNYSSTQNNLAWSDNSNNELGFKVYRAMNSSTSYAQVATTTWNTVSYNNTGLTADNTYFYKVVAFNSAGTTTSNSAWAITYNATPTAPASLTASSVGSNVLLTWADNSKNEDGFLVERSPDNVAFTNIATTTLNLTSATSYTDIAPGGGTFYYRVRAYNTKGYSSYSNTASSILPAQRVDVSGDITSNTTWDSGHLYVLSGTVTVDSGVTLTINPGTIVKFNGTMSKLDVSNNAVLNAQGTANSSIYFTSYYDDIGGDTNGDSTPAAAGNWDTIKLESGASSTLAYAVVRYGGYTGCCWGSNANVYNDGGTLTFTGSTSTLSGSEGIHSAAGTTTITSSEISNQTYGVYVAGSSIANLSSNKIHDHSQYGVYLLNTANLTLTNNTFSNNANGAAYVNLHYGPTFTHSGNTASGTGERGFVMIEELGNDQTWTAGDLPYIIENTVGVIINAHTLTINAGAIVKFEGPTALITVAGGTLNVQGTGGNKVYFTSLYDDTVGGDTDSSTSTSPYGGDWNTIEIDSGTAAISNAVIRYGGYTASFRSKANVYVTGGTLTMSDSEVTGGTAYGIYQQSGASTISSSNFHDMTSYWTYGAYLVGGSMSLVSSTLHDNAYGLYAAAGSLYFDNNTYYNNWSANTYIDPGVYLQQPGGGGGGGSNWIVVAGTINADTTWTATTYVVTSTLTVASGKMLTIPAGAIVKFRGSNTMLVVVGGIRATGSSGVGTIYFTSYNDDSVGGDTNGDGGATSATSGDWATLQFGNTSSSTISHAVVRYGGSSSGYSANLYNNYGTLNIDSTEVATSVIYGIRNDAGTLNINASEIHNQNTGLYVYGGTVTVTESAFYSNSAYGVNNVSGNQVTATNNYWGIWNGPTISSNPSGEGDVISTDVTYNPWHHVNHFWSVRSLQLNWFGGTQFTDPWNTATSAWADTGNGVGQVSINHVSSTSQASLIVQDCDGHYPGHDDWIAWTSVTSVPTVTDTLTFSIPVMTSGMACTDYTYADCQKTVALHELGHALGLGHSDPVVDDVMYSSVNDSHVQPYLGSEDKSDYHFLWVSMSWAVPRWWLWSDLVNH